MTGRIIALRPERGYSATNYDGSPARLLETLRRQFEQKYDLKKVRNRQIEQNRQQQRRSGGIRT
jgi:hypothetical protein